MCIDITSDWDRSSCFDFARVTFAACARSGVKLGDQASTFMPNA